MADIIFEPLHFKNLTVKNRIFRSNISGRFDNYDGSGNQARLNWEVKFAKGGVGAIISSFVPVHLRGRIVPNYAMIDSDERIPFWREVGKAVHAHDCKYILQLSHGGRQRDINGIEYPKGLSSTAERDPIHGFKCEQMSVAQIAEVVQYFADGARRAREAGLDGVELHGSNGYLITQFLSSAINDRKDDYGGPLENRARFVLEVVRAIRAEVGADFHLQMKISATDHDDVLALFKRGPSGNTVDESVKVCQWLVEAGVDAIHVSTGSFFPHPMNPKGVDLPVEDLANAYDTMISSGERTFLNFLLFHGRSGQIARRAWNDAAGDRDKIEGVKPEGLPRDQAGRHGPGDLHRRLPDRVGDSRRHRARRLRRGERGPNAGRQQRPGADVRARPGHRARTLYATATSAWSTSSRTRWAVTTSGGSRRATR